jgi:hypothetical protein
LLLRCTEPVEVQPSAHRWRYQVTLICCWSDVFIVLQVRVVVGEPVQVDDLLQRAREQGWGEDKLHRSIADRVGQRLVSMHDKLLGRHSIPAVVTHGAPSSTSQMSAPGFSQHGVAWQQLSFNMWHRQWCTTAAVSKALEEGKLASMP